MISSAFTKYSAFAAISIKHAAQNKVALIGSLFLLILLLFIYNQLWGVISNEASDSTINTNFIWYLLFGETIILSTSRSERIIEDDIKSGALAYYTNKPVSFFFMRYLEALGSSTVPFLAMLILGGAFVWLISPAVPFSLHHLPFIIAAAYFSTMLSVLIKIAIGYSALWLSEIRSITMAVERLAFILGGAIFPLTIYPDWFVNIAKFTPFYSLYYLTISLTYNFSWPNLFRAISLNVFWTLIIGTFLYFAYQKLQKRINTNGG